MRLLGFAVGFEGDIEIAAVSTLAHEVVPAGQRSTVGGFEINAGDGGRKVLVVSIFEDDHDGRLEVDAGNLLQVKGLAGSVLENDSDRSGVVGCRSSPGEAAGGKHEYGENRDGFHTFSHGCSPAESARSTNSASWMMVRSEAQVCSTRGSVYAAPFAD